MSHLSLLVLVLHNSILVLLLRASRSHSDHSSNPSDSPSLLYLASVAVVFTELLKLSICFLVLIFSMLSSSSSVPIRQGLACILSSVFQPREIIRLSLPSACYALQNNLLYLALSNLEAATFQVVYQLKILATALFSILLLRRTLSVKQWSSLLLLMMGVTLVQWQTAVPHHPSPGNSSEEPEEKPILGFMAVILACLSSGFAGCYFERILKSSSTYALPISPPSLWVRNGQLGISATFFSLLLMILTDGPMIRDHGLLQGFGPLPWIVVLNQALGGLLVAAVVKYADNILKGFATSLSILLSGLISYLFLGFHPTLPFLFGASLVLLSTFLYGRRA
ncbi:MAG: nucleotide-sugar transporter-domain-containing protein [Piptocephalis tieghemiana]|nr:MAG: nucleotide-sugar transporter-domain-containing protein [Piptocephalis tieghemiana]